ncbi:hypothetical protein EKO27_g10343 [Xylaria grammica]|uniref:Heterokaryon incompatibility domain-containing protein n=1 Tax=Xylaria grammica TaxID=363999 RepID=A0A439CRE8_9PEZI|nr:hypothetical protein EKO27_g10343 [Xylaria grammica]
MESYLVFSMARWRVPANCPKESPEDTREPGDERGGVPGKDDVSEYVTLSHPWGDPPHFVSTTENIDQHRKNINLDKLPATFRDAILTTRAIGERYLWIDSICILQGPGGDFHVEAGRMEAVFSSAYCVLAASRAHNQRDGFLGPRRERDYVAMYDPHRNANFFLCENIDAFDRHVLGRHLHKRGWVLQEHALARRTIFFTEHQTYWECGDGVQAFGTRGGYGVFDEDVKTGQLGLLRRSLLWYRAVDREGDSRLSRIEFSTTERTDSAAPAVPSWSWMAYIGEISFLQLDFGAIDWIKIRSPWGAEDGQATARFADGRRNLALKAPARIISVSPADAGGAGKLYFDDVARTKGKEMSCVVLGTDKQETIADEKVHYFILIEPAASSELGSSETYKRVGASGNTYRSISFLHSRVTPSTHKVPLRTEAYLDSFHFLRTKTVSAVGNENHFSYHYPFEEPVIAIDANDNIGQFAYHCFGALVGTTVKWKTKELLGDSLDEFAPMTTESLIMGFWNKLLDAAPAPLGPAGSPRIYNWSPNLRVPAFEIRDPRFQAFEVTRGTW